MIRFAANSNPYVATTRSVAAPLFGRVIQVDLDPVLAKKTIRELVDNLKKTNLDSKKKNVLLRDERDDMRNPQNSYTLKWEGNVQQVQLIKTGWQGIPLLQTSDQANTSYHRLTYVMDNNHYDFTAYPDSNGTKVANSYADEAFCAEIHKKLSALTKL